MKLNKQEIFNELKTNVNLFTITPNAIIKNFSQQEFREILNDYLPDYIFMLRLRSIEANFCDNDEWEYACVIRDYRNRCN